MYNKRNEYPINNRVIMIAGVEQNKNNNLRLVSSNRVL